MKRTLLEVFCCLAVLVLMASFHQQIARLEVHNHRVAELEARVQEVADNATSWEDVRTMEDQLLALMTDRMANLEDKLELATKGSEEAEKLRHQLETARAETDRFQVEIAQSVANTKDLVDAYMNEVRAQEEHSQASLAKTRDALMSLSTTVRPDPRELTRTMLLPTVQLNGDDTVGSGTLIYSGKNPRTNEVESYVVTSYHVVRNILADTPRARREGIETTIYLIDGKVVVRGDMIAHDARIDVALVKLRTTRQFPNVARVLAKELADQVRVWDPICAVGCPLGNDPVPSHGAISSKHNTLGGSNYWMINAPTYFGNSGGGVYLTDSRQLIGVFSKIYTHGKGNPVVVPHMGLCTPITAMYDWLEGEKLDWILLEQQGVGPRVHPALDPSMLAAPPK